VKIIGLDVGTKRIGVAKADSSTKIAVPNGFVNVNGQEFAEIARIARMYSTSTFVVGLPRNNSGEETKQSLYAREFARQLAMSIPDTKIYFEDESLTSVEAERRLKERKKNFEKGEIDAEAASIILQDFLERSMANSEILNQPYTFEQAKLESDAKKQESPENTPKKTKNKGKNKVLKRVIIAILMVVVLGAGLLGGAYFWYKNHILPVVDAKCEYETPEAEALNEKPDNNESCRFKQFTIESSDTTAKIAENLKKDGLIRSDLAFRIYVKLNRMNVKYGIYSLRATMSTQEIAEELANGAPADNVFNITVLPGETIEDIKAKLLKQGYLADDIKVAFEKQYNNKVLKGLYDQTGNLASTSQPRSVQLEGYIFGDTYQFYKTESLDKIISTMIDALGDVVTANNLESKFNEKGLSLRDGIILASIVQKETPLKREMPIVASVYLNRLNINMRLQSCPTVIYPLTKFEGDMHGAPLLSGHLKIDSPYNTYTHNGLPPHPIANVGRDAIRSVLKPANTKYLFFVADGRGGHKFSRDYSEHQKNHEIWREIKKELNK
jgi:UPF0755 protein